MGWDYQDAKEEFDEYWEGKDPAKINEEDF